MRSSLPSEPAAWGEVYKALDTHLGKPTFILESPFNEAQPAFSPDGRFIAYVSNETGRIEVYVRPYPGPGRKVPISTGGGWSPRWSLGGSEIFYRSGDKMMAVPVTTRPSFIAGKPVALFEGPYRSAEGEMASVPEYDVTPDGQGFVMIRYGADTDEPQKIHVVLNWLEELKQRIPEN